MTLKTLSRRPWLGETLRPSSGDELRGRLLELESWEDVFPAPLHIEAWRLRDIDMPGLHRDTLYVCEPEDGGEMANEDAAALVIITRALSRLSLGGNHTYDNACELSLKDLRVHSSTFCDFKIEIPYQGDQLLSTVKIDAPWLQRLQDRERDGPDAF